MLERIKLVLALTAPIGGVLLGGWWVLHIWGKSNVLVWWVVPLSVVGFNLWWHWRWRRRLGTRITALEKGVAHPKSHASEVGKNAAGAP